MADESQILAAGRYKGRAFSWVWYADSRYAMWVMDHPEEDPAFAVYVRRKFSELPTTQSPTTGPVTATRLAEIFSTHRSFQELVGQPQITQELLGVEHSRPAHFQPGGYGQFTSYLVRHVLSSLKGVPATDMRAELVVQSAMDEVDSDASTEEDSEPESLDELSLLRRSYQIFQTCSDTTAIIPHIYNTSIAQSICFQREDEFRDPSLPLSHFLSEEMYRDISSYLQRFAQSTVLFNPSLGNEKVKADANLIVDSELIAIRTHTQNTGRQISDFYRLYLYAALYLQKSSQQLQKLTIYNPLLNYTYSVSLAEFDLSALVEYIERMVVPE